ncbi:MAG: hypothetical protein PHS14_18295 [Elusimicrobia bacterium]|nr:hypothetical protein [Elusimicrobiota bacterium]
MRRTCLLLLVAAAAACGQKEPPPAPPPSALEQAVRVLSAQGACATLIPQEWSPSWPVPSKRGGALRYRLFFFGREGDPQKGFTFHAPQGEADFTPDGRVLECRRLEGEPVAIPRDGRFAAMTLDEIMARSSRLYADTEAVAALYASGRDIGDTGRARVAAFARDLAALADPAHASAYRGLDPDFWAWVEKNGGAVPAK